MQEHEQEPRLVDLEAQRVAVVRERVPLGDMRSFYDRAFHTVMTAAQSAGVTPSGPAIGHYRGMPTDSADVAAGFPLPPGSPAHALPVASADDAPAELGHGEVHVETLPAGRAAQLLHVGSYDGLGAAYQRMFAWMQRASVVPADHMWESYLTEPTPDGDPSSMQTLLTWPVRG